MQPTFSPGRLEAFSDGVIAVIITIMVLELKVPAQSGLAGFHSVVSTLLVYALSFMFIGVYWVNHHALIGRLAQSNNRILWANLVWLFALSLIPFFTDYINVHFDAFAVTIYCTCMLAAGMTFLLLRYTVDCQLQRDGRRTRLDQATQLKHWGSLAIYALSIYVAHSSPRLALWISAIVTLVWIAPTLGIFGGSYGGDAPHMPPHEISPLERDRDTHISENR
jgi:uncharacterized membrane protein